MSRTNAGYTITDSIFIGKAEFVIGHNPSFSTPYVTWECKDGDNYFWGHYLTERKAAERDLLERAQTELSLQEQQKPPQPLKDFQQSALLKMSDDFFFPMLST